MNYKEAFKLENPWIFEFSRLIFERCPGHYFTGGPVLRPACQDPESSECIGCQTCWKQTCTGNYIPKLKTFPNDSSECYKGE